MILYNITLYYTILPYITSYYIMWYYIVHTPISGKLSCGSEATKSWPRLPFWRKWTDHPAAGLPVRPSFFSDLATTWKELELFEDKWLLMGISWDIYIHIHLYIYIYNIPKNEWLMENPMKVDDLMENPVQVEYGWLISWKILMSCG